MYKRQLSVKWKGEVRFAQADAVEWLRSQRGKFDLLLEDLSIGRDGDVFKPDVSIDALPGLIQSKLKPGGIAVFNLLPADDQTWVGMTAEVCAPFEFGVQILFESYYNRVLIQGSSVGRARSCGDRLRKLMRLLGSDLTDDIRLRTLQGAH